MESPPLLQHQQYRGWPLLKNIVAAYLFVSLLAQQQVQSHLLSSNINYELLATHTASKMEHYLSNLICEINKGERRQDEPALQRYLKDYQLILQEANGDPDRYLSNPVNEYLLVKRMNDWNHLRHLIDSDQQHHLGLNNSKSLYDSSFLTTLPTTEDVSGAALGLVQLQATYDLATGDLSEGKVFSSFTGRHSSSRHRMTAGDCLQLGRQAYLIGEDKIAVTWMEESLRKYHQENENDKTARLQDILKYYAFSSLEEGHNSLASKLIHQLLQLLPGGQSELRNISKSEVELRLSTIKETAHSFHDQDYKSLCKGEKLMDSTSESQLHCSYTGARELSAFMTLQPFKREQISLIPPVTVFYDVLSDKEIQVLQELAQPKFKVGLDFKSLTGESYVSQRRISLETFLSAEEHTTVEKVSRRIQDITGLQLTYDLKVIHYSVGGRFIPHWDYTLDDTWEPDKGNRIATWLFYLNDVESGGFTAFTEAKTFVKPVKGSAAFWYNLLPNGQGDTKTKHAGCPVLAGCKWVIDNTFGSKGQEFRRPCNLNFHAEV